MGTFYFLFERVFSEWRLSANVSISNLLVNYFHGHPFIWWKTDSDRDVFFLRFILSGKRCCEGAFIHNHYTILNIPGWVGKKSEGPMACASISGAV